MAVNASLLLLRRSRGSFLPLRRSLSAVGVAGASFSSPSSSLVLARNQLTSASSILPWNPIHLSLHQSFRRFSSAAFSSSSSAAVAEVVEQPAAAVVSGSEVSDASSSLKERFKFAYQNHKPRQLGIDEIEGCDFNHWLIVVDFPKNPRPSHEEMVRFYEETCSKSLNISLEEAKKKMYACSTSNYTGFHVAVTEVESEKFNGQPGVIFVLPDSYVDKEKKEYGGDKYINGVIIPRPRSGRHIREDFKQDRQQRPIPLRQESPASDQERPIQGQRQDQDMQSSYNHQAPTQGRPMSYNHQAPTQGRPMSYQQRNTPQDNHHRAPQSNQIPYKNGFQGQPEIRNQGSYQFQQNYNHPLQGENMHQPNRPFQHSYNLPVQGERRDTTPMRSSYGQENGGLAPYQENYNQAGAGNFYPQGLRELPQGYTRANYAPPTFQGGFREDYQNYRSGDRVPEAYYQNVNTGSIQQGNHRFIHRQPGGYQGQGAPEPYWQGSDSRFFQRGYLEPIQSQPFSQDQRNFQGPGFDPIRGQAFEVSRSEPIRSQPFSQDPRNLQGPSFEPIRGQAFSQDQMNFQGPSYREPIHSQPISQDHQGLGYREPMQPLSQDQRNLQGPGYRDATHVQPFSQDQRSFQRHGFDPIQSRPFSQDQTNFQRPGVEPIQSRPFLQDQTNFQRPGGEPFQSRPFSQDQTNFQRPGVEPIQSRPFSQDQTNFQRPGVEPIQSRPFSPDQTNFQRPSVEPFQSQPFSQGQRNFQGPGFEPIHSQPLPHDNRNFQGPEFVPFKSQSVSQDQRNFQGPGFNPQEYREPPPGYQWNYAPPVGYQAGFGGEHGYSSKPIDLYRQGPTVGGYQAHRDPEAYRQGPNYGGVGPSYAGPPNAQRGPKYETGFKQDYQSYGPPHGTIYQNEDNGYQGQGPAAPFWRRSSF